MKLLGITIILLACTAMGFYIDAWQRERVRELEELMYAFEILKGEIDYRLTPLIEACQTVSDMTSQNISLVFKSFGQCLRDRQAVDTKQMWEQSIRVNKGELHLTDEDYMVLSEFGSIVGHLDKEMQKRNIELLLNKLGRVKDEAKERYARTSKMYKGMGILIGACISIVLI